MSDLARRARQDARELGLKARDRALLLGQLAAEIERLRAIAVKAGVVCPKCYKADPVKPCPVCGHGLNAKP